MTTDIQSGGGTVTSLNLNFAGNVIPLIEFNTKYSKNGMVTTQVKRNGGAATLQRAFAARVFGPMGIYERVGAPRFPVEQKYGPSTAHMIQNEDVLNKMETAVLEVFDTRMEHEITRILNGWGG